MTILVLWRHAATPFNNEQRLQGLLDIALDDAGRTQAQRAAVALADTVGAIDGIHTSPLTRARETAQPLGDITGVHVEINSGLTQRAYGVWEGMTWAEVERDFPHEYAQRMRNEDPAIDGWETAADVAERVAAALVSIASRDGNHVAVSHGSSLSLGMLALLGEDLHSTAFARLRHARWVVLRPRVDDGWQVQGFNLGTD